MKNFYFHFSSKNIKMKQFNLVRNLEQFVRYFPIFKINLLFFIRCETSACLHATIYLWFTAPRGKGHLFWKKKRSLIYAKKQEQEQHRPIPLGRTTNDSKYCRGQFTFKRSFFIFWKSIDSSTEQDSHNSYFFQHTITAFKPALHWTMDNIY